MALTAAGIERMNARQEERAIEDERVAFSRARRIAQRAIRTAIPKTKFTGERPSVFLYGGATLIALLKDLLDLVGVGSLPGVGTIVTICFSLLIFLLLTVFDRSGGGNAVNKKITQGLIMTFMTLIEALGFGLNFLPLETFTIIGLYLIAHHVWQREKKESESNSSQHVYA